MLRTLFATLCFIVFGSLYAQIPDYYKNIDFNKSGIALKEDLSYLIITTHVHNIPYTSNRYTDIWATLKVADTDPENADNVLLLYGANDTDEILSNDRSRSKNLSCHSNSCTGMWVREHVYSKSWGTPNLGTEFAGSDAYNLKPVDPQRNISRSNRKFARGIGDAHITNQGFWYPGDEWKGDVARTMMYMYLRYPTQCDIVVAGVSESTFSLDDDMLDIFLEWNAEDPVSDVEINRNEVIFQLQGNRNPFIDNPFLATLIWNGPEAEMRWDLKSSPTPIHYSSMDSIQVYRYQNQIFVKGLKEPSDYQIFNIDGKLLQSGRVESTINISQYISNVLLFKLVYENQDTFVKLLK